jgi:hypothetical protein
MRRAPRRFPIPIHQLDCPGAVGLDREDLEEIRETSSKLSIRSIAVR